MALREVEMFEVPQALRTCMWRRAASASVAVDHQDGSPVRRYIRAVGGAGLRREGAAGHPRPRPHGRWWRRSDPTATTAQRGFGGRLGGAQREQIALDRR